MASGAEPGPFTFAAKGYDERALRDTYERLGFFSLRGVFDRTEIATLREETGLICSGQRGAVVGADVVSADATDPDTILRRVLAVHFPHKASQLVRETLFRPEIVAALNVVIGPDVKCMQSMLFVKNAGKPGQAWHQDEHYIATRDRSLIGAWIALDDARVDNGGLWMHPGSHRAGVLWQTRPHGDARFDPAEEAFGFPYEREGGVPVEADAGDVVFFHGYVLHRSLENRCESGFRRALVHHYMNARSLLPWAFDRPARSDFRDFELVSGHDPYAWKPREEITVPFVRPESPEQARQVYGALAARARSKGV